MELKNYFAQDSLGNAQAGATCHLYAAGTETHATGLIDVQGHALLNPFPSDTNGLIQFKAPDGLYDLRVVSGVRDYRLRIQCFDINGTNNAGFIAFKADMAGSVSIGLPSELVSNGIRPEWFGAVGDGIADDSNAVNLFVDACLNLKVKGRGTPGAKYNISTQITKTLISNQILNIDWNGSVLVQGGNNLVMNLLNSAVGPIAPVQSITETSVNLGNGSANTFVMQIVSIAHPFTKAGEVGKIFSDDLAPDADGNNQFCGEFFSVGSIIDANTFTTTGVFDERYSINPKVVKPSNAKVRFDNFAGESVWADTTTSSFMNVQGFITPKLSNLSAKDVNAAFLNLTSNYKPEVHGVIGRSLKNRPDLGAYGYLVNDSAGYYGDISGINCVLARHAYTTTTPTSPVLNDDKWWLRGRTIGTVVRNSTGQGCANAFDTHSPALRITFVNCTPIDDFRGNDTGGAGIQIRANDCQVIDCDVTNSKIGVAQSGARKTSNATLLISGLRYRGPNGHIPVVINGSTTYETIVNFDNGDITSRNGVMFDVTNANLYVTNTNVKFSPDANGSSVVKLNTGANVDWIGGSVNVLAGVAHKLVEHADTNTTCFVEGLRVRGVTGRLSYLSVSAAQYSVQSRFRKLQLDAALPGTPFLGVEAILPKVSAEYTVGYNAKPIGYRVYVFPAAGNQALDLQYTGHDSVYVRIEAQIAGVVINSISQGAFPGQRLIINNRNTSTSSFVIANSSAGLLLMGTSATLTAGRGITLVWDGSNWRSADMH